MTGMLRPPAGPLSGSGRHRRTRVRGTVGAASALVLLLAIAGCSAGTDAPDDTDTDSTPVVGGTLRVAQPDEPTTLDPALGTCGCEMTVLYSLYDTLVDYDPQTLEPVPGLVEEWNYEDPQTLSLTLHDDVLFSDGTPLDAEAVKFNFDRILTTPEASGVAEGISAVDSVEVVDPLRVQLNLSRPDSSLLIKLADRAGMMVSPTAADAAQPLSDHPVGTGPFILEDWAAGDRITLVENPDYWQDGLPYLDSLVYQHLDVTAAVNALESGQVDIIPPEVRIARVDRDRLTDTPGIGSSSMDAGLFTHHIYFNMSRPPFDNVEVRQAVNAAIDRNTLLEAIQGGDGQVMTLPVPPAHWAHSGTATGDYSHNPGRARSLLAEAGYPDGLDVSFLTTTEPVRSRMAEAVQTQLAEVGINVDIRELDVVPAITEFFQEQADDLYLMGWSGRLHPTQTYTAMFSSTGFFNAGGATIPGFDEALAAIRSIPAGNVEERDRAWRAMNELILEQAPIAPLLFLPNIALYRDNVHDFATNLLLKPKYGQVWLDPSA